MTLSPKILLLVGGAIIVILAVVFAARSAQEANKLRAEITTLQQQAQQQGQANPEEVKTLVDEVSKLIVLPEGEEPTVATITDREKLTDVPFFAKAENGDKVLIYVNARKAFLYRPSTKKLIEVATLNLNTANQNFVAKVVLRNGTEVAGLTKRLEDSLKQSLPNVEVVGRDDTAKPTYTQTLVIDVTGTKKEDASRLAAALGAKVATLPADEPKPAGADFLVLIGADKAATPTPASSPATSPKPSPGP